MQKSPNNISYIFFFECTQETRERIMNYAVAQKTCKRCIDTILNDDSMFCNFCGQRERHFSTATDFCEWAFSKEHKGYTSIAHNMKAYDGYYFLDHVLNRDKFINPEFIFRINKILSIHMKDLNIRVIDSLNFIPSPLSKFPDTFGIHELKEFIFHFYLTSQIIKLTLVTYLILIFIHPLECHPKIKRYF